MLFRLIYIDQIILVIFRQGGKLGIMPFLMSDAEFDETFQEYYDQFIAG